MSATVSTPAGVTPSTRDLVKKIDDVRLSKADMNAMVMNYLITAGYRSAAEKFAQEAGLQSEIDLTSIEKRNQICNSIHHGEIKSAIELINDFEPELLQTHPRLHFALLRLQLIELIRISMANNEIEPALTFAQEYLAPRAPQYPEFLKDLEHTMALLCFPPDQLSPPLAKLLDPDMRKQVATMVNQTILESQGVCSEAKINGLVKLGAWVETKAAQSESSRLSSVPRMDLGLAAPK